MERVAGTQNNSHQTKQLERVFSLAAANNQNADDDRYQINGIKKRF